MSTYRSANTRQSQTQSQNQVYSTIQKRNPQFNAKQIPQLRPGQMRPGQGQPGQGGAGSFQKRRGGSVASTSVYDPEEGPPNVRLTFKQAITLITLRLGKLEVFMNETKITGFPKGDFEDGSKNIDKDFLLSIVARLDNMEKAQHNVRVEVENLKKTLNELQSIQTDIVDQPVILDIFERLENLDLFAKSIQENQFEPENVENIEPETEPTTVAESQPEAVNTIVPENILVYNPSIIEPYAVDLTPVPTVPTVEVNPFSQPIPPTTTAIAPVQEVVSQVVAQEQNPKTPRKRAGKKIAI